MLHSEMNVSTFSKCLLFPLCCIKNMVTVTMTRCNIIKSNKKILMSPLILLQLTGN